MMLFMLLVTLMTFAVCVSAQEIDVDSMNNEQLMLLLQAIMQKLELNETEDAEESLPNVTEMPVIDAARFSDRKLFTIYENKKLIIEAIPEYMFTQKSDETPEPEKHDNKEIVIEQRNFFKVGDTINIFGPNKESFNLEVKYIKDIDGNLTDAARHAQEIIRIPSDIKVSKYDLIRVNFLSR